jgi:hypothetical protein
MSARGGRHYGGFVIVSGKAADTFQIIEPHNRHELDFIAQIAAQEVNSPVPGNLTLGDANEDFFFEKLFIDIRVGGRGPSMPDSTDHLKPR